jgi:hypothetical protein
LSTFLDLENGDGALCLVQFCKVIALICGVAANTVGSVANELSLKAFQSTIEISQSDQGQKLKVDSKVIAENAILQIQEIAIVASQGVILGWPAAGSVDGWLS